MTYLIAKIIFSVSVAGILGFVIGWWWTRQAERCRSIELEGVWTQKVQRANRELDALRLDLRTEANRSIAASDAEDEVRRSRQTIEEMAPELQESKRRADALQAEVDKLKVLIEHMPGMTLLEPPSLVPADASAGPDDLKSIKGIGPVLEKKLNSMGISQYRQIARWTADHINYYQAMLPEFKNRIARDRWVQSASDRHFEKYGDRI